MNSSSATNSSLSSFSDECETTLPDRALSYSSTSITNHERVNGKKPVHKIEPIFTSDTKRMRVFLEDGSLSEYSIHESTKAYELIEEISVKHCLGSDMRRYRLTLNEAQNTSWRAIRYIRPQQTLLEISTWSCLTETTVCTLRVVIIPNQAEVLAETEPITFTYLYRQSINDYIRERAGSEITIDIAVQLTVLLILDESLCTNIRPTILVKRSWLLRQLFPRSLLEQFSMKQLIHRIRQHLVEHENITQLTVAKQFIRIFSENTRSFGGKLFPVKFPDKHRDSILLVGPRHPIAILDQARRVHSPVITLVSAWSNLSRVVIKQYRNGVAIRLVITPRPTNESSTLLQQEISFLIHTNLLNDLIAFIEGYSQIESNNSSLAIERISHVNGNKTKDTTATISNDEPTFIKRILSNRKARRTYSLIQEKITPPASPSLYELTRQFFSRNSPKTLEIDDRETISNVPNRTTLITWRSIADTQSTNPIVPPPVFYRTVIDVKQKTSSSTEDELDVVDLTASYGYYGTVSFPLRPPSPFADGQRFENETYSSSTKYSSSQYNTNNNNNNNSSNASSSSESIRSVSSLKLTFDRILKRDKSNKCCQPTGKRVHWLDNDERILCYCQEFVENLKLLVQNSLDNFNFEIYINNCWQSLEQLEFLVDCSQLKQAFTRTIQFARRNEKLLLLQQQTFIAHLISCTVLS